MKKIFIYKLESENLSFDKNQLGDHQVKKWSPGITKYIPPNSSLSYISFWLAHYFNFFQNRNYSAYAIYDNGKPVCSLVCIPALFKWRFMKPNDLQIKNVFTHEDYRGQGFAYSLVSGALQQLKNKNTVFWYMTDEHNTPSQKLCKKIGFEYVGNYKRSRNKYLFHEGNIITEDISR